MLKIDAHQHFWNYDPIRDSWINEDMKRIQRDFLPEDLEPTLKENGFDGCVTVQSDQSESENEFQLQNAQKNDFIKGVVGWIDLQSPEIEQRLSYYKQFEKLKGFRHVLQGEPQRDLMLRPAFKNGIRSIGKFGYTYDLLIFPDQIGYSTELVSSFPDQVFVIDHIAKPAIKRQKIKEWKKDITSIAERENVFCKLSGLVTEADWNIWRKEDFKIYLDVVIEAFGMNRVMYGSDWPVCLVAASYNETLEIVSSYFDQFSSNEKALFFGGNAQNFYKL